MADGKSMAFSAQALVGSGLTVAMDGPVSTADFQTLQAQAPAITADAQDMLGKMENLQIQLGSAQAQITAGTASPASTLAGNVRVTTRSFQFHYGAHQCVPHMPRRERRLAAASQAHSQCTPAAAAF